MLCALYAGVSTTDQTCEAQLQKAHAYFARRGWQLTAERVDTWFSGAKASYPELDREEANRRNTPTCGASAACVGRPVLIARGRSI